MTMKSWRRWTKDYLLCYRPAPRAIRCWQQLSWPGNAPSYPQVASKEAMPVALVPPLLLLSAEPHTAKASGRHRQSNP